MLRSLVLSAILLPLLPGLVLGSGSTASRIESLRKNPLYITASGQNSDLEIARRFAEKALVSQIQVAVGVTSQYTSNAREDNDDLKLTTEFVTRHQSYAGMLLKGLGFIESREKNDWSVFAYIHRDSLAASYAYQRSRIIGLTTTGVEAVKRGSLGEGLKRLHQAWLLAHFYPDTINNLPYMEDVSPTNPLAAIGGLINRYLAWLHVVAGDCYKDDPLIIAPLQFSLNGEPVRDLTISYYGGHGMEFARVIDGKADLPVSFQPVSREQRLLITIEYIFDAELKSDVEFAGLYEMFGSGDFPNLKSVMLRFPWILPEPSIPPEPLAPAIISPAIATPDLRSDAPLLKLSEPLVNLYRQYPTPDFLEMLVQYSKLGALSYGRKSDFGDGVGCQVAVFDDKHVIVFLHFDGFQFRTMDGKTIYNDLSGEFRGMRQVWIREAGK